ncbi:MAG: hypothetical protein IT245_07710, partial [Bacteroidia bacterium]|nr:hypothetical protein [Bacteroidia bacterium]
MLKYKTIARTLTVLLLCFWTFQNAQATHIAGAEIQYKHVSGNSYKFILKVYRDCRECKFNNIGGGDVNSSCNEVPDLQIKGAVGTTYANTSVGSIAVSRVAITDLSGTCYNTLSKCRPGSNAFFGYEVHVFEGVYDFSTALDEGYCKLDVSIGMSSRNININSQFTEQNFFNFCTINLCEGVPNTSTVFDTPPQFLLIASQTNYQSLGILNQDGDSLAFSLKPALRNRNVSVSYATGYDFDHPFNVYCNGVFPCPPNINGPIVEGFYCNKLTGDIAFTPILLNQGGVIVVECEEWKRKNDGSYYLAGVTRRDVYSDVIAQNNNLPKIKNRITEFNICEGEDLKIDLDLEDLPFLGLNSDSVFVDIKSTFKAVTLLVVPRNTAPFASYSVFTGNTTNQVGRHYVTVKIWDNNCPMRGTASKTFIVNVQKARANTLNYSVKNCGVLDVSSSNLGNMPIYWTVSDINNQLIKEQFVRKMSVQLPSGGKYIVKSYLPAQNGFCAMYNFDTIDVEDFIVPQINMGVDKIFCNGAKSDIVPTSLTTTGDYDILVNGLITPMPYSFDALSEKTLTFKVLQKDGCFAEDQIKLKLHPVLQYQVADDTFCVNSEFPALIKNIGVNKNDILAIDMSVNSPGVSINQLNAFDWSFDLINPGSRKIIVYSLIQDKNYCVYMDTFAINIVEPTPINLPVSEFVCINSEAITLPVKNNGSWSCTNRPDLLNLNTLTIDKTDNTTLKLVYKEKIQCENKKEYEIQVKDTSMISLPQGPNIQICQSQSPFVLQAIPAGGQWLGYYLNGNVFDAYSAAGKTTQVSYEYTNANTCISHSTASIYVEKLP